MSTSFLLEADTLLPVLVDDFFTFFAFTFAFGASEGSE